MGQETEYKTKAYFTSDQKESLRDLAEKKLVEEEAVTKSSGNKFISQAFAYNTIHELRVHQIELEMQNEELRRAQNELFDLQERYFDLYDLAPIGYMTLSLQSIVQETNLAAATLLGFSRSSLIGLPLSRFILKEDQDIYYLLQRHLFKTHEIQTAEIRMVNNQGDIFWVLLRIVESKNNDILTIRIIITDISDQKIRERETQLRKAAELSNEAKSQFLSNMSHEIRTPMNGILGAIQLLELTSLNDEQIEVVKIAHVASESLLNLINDILDYSKIEADKVAFEQIPFKLNQLIDDTLILFNEALRKKGLQINVFVNSDVPNELVGDPFRLRQVLSNIIGNGIKFTHAGSINIEVSLLETKDLKTASLKFRINDTGIGICSEAIGSLFDRFNQADNSNTREYGGTGLGLAISKGLIGKMGGQIWVESELGKGSTFYITCTLGISCCMEQDFYNNRNQIDQFQAKKISIMLVEDNWDSQYVMKLFSKKMNWDLTIAENGHEALIWSAKKTFDLILMDLQMPVMDGFETSQKIRQTKSNRTTPIIALTAFAMEGTEKSCLESGMNDYMTKPIILSELQKVIISWTPGI